MFAFPRLRSRFPACTYRLSGYALLAGLLLFSPDPSALAQDAKKKTTKAPTVELKSVVAKDGWKLKFAYFNSGKGKDSPVVILLHGKNSNHLAWNAGGFGRKLQQQGYAVIALDLRKHGRSKATGDGTSSTSKKKKTGGGSADLSASDYQAMILLDLPRIKQFIKEEHQAQHLNMRKTAIIAADMSGPIALNFAALDWKQRPYPDAPRISERTPRGQDIRALVLISPELNLPKVLSGPAIQYLRPPEKNIAFLVCYSKNSKSVGNAKKIVQQLSPSRTEKKRIYDYQFSRKDIGTDLLGKGLKIETNIFAFLDRHLKKLPEEWRDRKSKLID